MSEFGPGAYFIPSENNQRNRAYEDLVGSLVELVDDPRVSEALGEEAAFAHADFVLHSFLPNVRNGLYVTPDAYRDTDRIAIVPVMGVDSSLEEVVEPLQQEIVDRGTLENQFSVAFGHVVDERDLRDRILGDRFDLPALPNLEPGHNKRGEAVQKIARSFVRLTFDENDTTYNIHRRVLGVSMPLTEVGPYTRGTTMRHDIGHMIDADSDPIGFMTPQGHVWTEARQYHYDFTVNVALGVRSDMTTLTMEHARLTNTLPGKPFTYTPELYVAQHAQGTLH